MKILVTGATGLIGGHLIPELIRGGDIVHAWVRNKIKAESIFGNRVLVSENLTSLGSPESYDAIINLAGEPIADKPWSEKRKRSLRDSRIALSEQLAMWLQPAKTLPVILSGSAVGVYGDTGNAVIDENTPTNRNDFAAELCSDWEAVFKPFESKTRVVYLRTGLVLSTGGGLLKKMHTPFKLGLGAQLGNGEQYMPWIHWQDYCAALCMLLDAKNCNGPFNLAAPHPVQNTYFTKELGRQLRRPAVFKAPTWALKAALREMSILLLGGQNITPTKLLEHDFEFQYPEFSMALDQLLS